MNTSQKTRLTKLEEKQSKIDQVKQHCSCYCHNKLPFELSEEKIERVIEILKSLEIHNEDGTITNAYELHLAKMAEREPCTCNH